MQAALRWKNGDRQMIELEASSRKNGKPDLELLYRTAEDAECCGGHPPGTVVPFALNLSLWHLKSQVVYVEFP